MRFGNRRGVAIALGIACALAFFFTGVSGGNLAKADGFACTIPSLVQAVDQNTGQSYMAPPVPNGHYVGMNLTGKISSRLAGLGHGGGLGGLGGGCGLCGGKGCGSCLGDMKPCGLGGCGLGLGHKSGCKVFASKQCVTPVLPCVKPSGQHVKPSGQCATAGCGLLGKHGKPGCGLFHKGACGDGGCGLKGCNSCGGLGGLGHGSGLGAGAHALADKVLHRNQVKWFVGAGGPVPITPGYTPYVVTTRSPRDFLSFPPFTP